MDSHLQSATSLHLELAYVKFESTEVRLTNTEAKLNVTEAKLNVTEAKLNVTEAKLNVTEAKLNDTEAKLHETQVKLSNTEETTRKLRQKLDILQRQFENTSEEKIVMAKKERANCPSEFVWKITNFPEILRQGKTDETEMIESVPFYTEHYGYKFKVRVYPNGIRHGKKTHLSVYIIVMKGEYDAILPWPFKKKIIFAVIDQQEDPIERQNAVMKLTPGDHPHCYARPINEYNATRGFAQFITHEKLHSRRYLRDDTLFLQVKVGP